MSLLNIATSVADAVGLPRPSAIASSTDQLARQMFALANEVLEDLHYLDWPILEIPYSFNTVIGQESYNLPTDWERSINDTAYIASQYYNMRGSLTSNDWQRNKNALPSQIGRYKYKIYGNPLKIYIHPVPMTVETIVLEYITSNKAQNTVGTFIPQFAADTDTPIVPESLVRKGLKWKIKHAKGMEYGEDFNDYERSKQTLFAQQLDIGAIPVALRRMIDIPEVPNGYIPEFGFGA